MVKSIVNPGTAVAQVSKEMKDGGRVMSEKGHQEIVKIPSKLCKLTDAPYCMIGFDTSYTRNLGNFQSTRVSVSLSVPCLPDDLDEMFEFVKDWAEAKLDEVLEE